MSWSSASVGFCPRLRITSPSSAVEMLPLPSLSKRLKTSLKDWTCSAERASIGVLAEAEGGLRPDWTVVLILGGAEDCGKWYVSGVVCECA